MNFKKAKPRRFLQKEFNDGYDARKSHIKKTANPYPPDSFRRYSWERGWVAADIIFSSDDNKDF